MADTPEAIRKSIRTYLFVGGILFIGTVITVLVATQEWLDFGGHGFDWHDAVVGMIIATVKASCVAAVFMHLNHEKKGIYWIFYGSLVFCAALFALIGLAKEDPIEDPYFYHPGEAGAPAVITGSSDTP